MIHYLGNTICYVSLLISLLELGYFIFGTKSNLIYRVTDSTENYKTIAMVLAMLALILAFVYHDFSLVSVYSNSSTSQPLIYRISASWSHHNGSILLWTTVMQCQSFIFRKYSRFDNTIKYQSLNIHNIIIAMFLGYMMLFSNPFDKMPDTVNNGLGMNTILQDHMVSIHPTKLYIGYIGSILIFAISCGILTSRQKISQDILKKMQPWIMFSWTVLFAGISLGSKWAYSELGWGGFWFWDPVENISLIVLLILTTMFHVNMMAYQSHDNRIVARISLKLGLIAGISAVIGTLIIRSGSLTSVHSFAAGVDRGLAMLVICIAMISIAIISYTRFTGFPTEASKTTSTNHIKNKIIMIIGMHYLITMIIAVVAIGTLLPIIMNLFNVHISIGIGYYNKICGIITILILSLCSFVTALDIRYRYSIKRIVICCILGSAITALMILSQYRILIVRFDSLISIIIILISNILIVLTASFGLHNRHNVVAMLFGHTGISIMLIGAVFAAQFGRDMSIIMEKDKMYDIYNFDIIYRGVRYDRGKNYLTRISSFDIIDRSTKTAFTSHPETRFYPIEDTFGTDSDIIHSGASDLYMTIGKLIPKKDNNHESIETSIFYRPMIRFIWLGSIMIYMGGLFSLIKLIRFKTND